MKKFVVFGLLAALVFCLPAAAQVRFKDMPDDHWAAAAVYDLVKRGITDGFPDGTFRGTETLTRYQTAVFLYKMANSIERKIVSRSEIQRMIANSGGGGTAAGGSGVSGVVYFAYVKNLQNSGITNNFDIERVYVTLKNKLSGNASSKVTFDVGRASGSTANLYSYLKYAYVDLMDVMPGGLGATNVRIGLQPTYWIGYADKVLGIRYISKSLTDLNSVLSSADFGVGGYGDVNIAGLPKAKWYGAVINGAGYKSQETNSAKTINLRVDAEVAPGLTIAGGGQIEDVGTSSTVNPKLVNGLVAYKAEGLKTLLEAFYGKNALGVSGGVVYEVVPAINLIARVDSYDPDRGTDNDQTTTVIAGASYDWGSSVKLAADIKSMTTGTADPVAVAELRSQISF